MCCHTVRNNRHRSGLKFAGNRLQFVWQSACIHKLVHLPHRHFRAHGYECGKIYASRNYLHVDLPDRRSTSHRRSAVLQQADNYGIECILIFASGSSAKGYISLSPWRLSYGKRASVIRQSLTSGSRQQRGWKRDHSKRSLSQMWSRSPGTASRHLIRCWAERCFRLPRQRWYRCTPIPSFDLRQAQKSGFRIADSIQLG